MKNLKFALSALLAAGAASVAMAAGIDTAANDVILGFRSTSASSVNLEVNLGSISQFTQASAGSTFTVDRLAAADLATVFGGSWNTSALQFGFVSTDGKTAGSAGPDGQATSTVWLSWDGASAPTRSTSSAQNFAITDISLMYNPLQSGALNNSNTTTLSNAYSAQIDATVGGSWTKSETVIGGKAFHNYTLSSFEATGGFTGSTSINLYELQPGSGAGSQVGTFTLTDTGVLSFTSSGLYAIPEPSTYAAIAGLAMLGFAGFRRRRIQNKA